MSRAGRQFQAVFDELAEALDFDPADVAGNADLRARLLKRFNRAYADAFTLRTWEDAWRAGELTPVAGLITLAQVEDARYFEFWSADPRVRSSSAHEIGRMVDGDGIHLQSTVSPVFAFWMPKAPLFTTTAYAPAADYAVGALVLSGGHVYRCVQAGTGQDPATQADYWTAVTVLSVLADPVVEMAAGRHLIATGKFTEGNARRADAQMRLEREAQIEFARLAKAGGRPWTQPALLQL